LEVRVLASLDLFVNWPDIGKISAKYGVEAIIDAIPAFFSTHLAIHRGGAEALLLRLFPSVSTVRYRRHW
jgi:hypothetical protein